MSENACVSCARMSPALARARQRGSRLPTVQPEQRVRAARVTGSCTVHEEISSSNASGPALPLRIGSLRVAHETWEGAIARKHCPACQV